MKANLMCLAISLSLTSCRSADKTDQSMLESTASRKEQAFEYSCQSKNADLGISRDASIKFSNNRVLVSYKDIDNESVQMFGEIDKKYKPRTSRNAIRYKTFDWGADCELMLIVDRSVQTGSTEPVDAKFYCSSEGERIFKSYECDSPKSGKMDLAKAPVTSPASTPRVTHICTGSIAWHEDFKSVSIGASDSKLTLRYGPKISDGEPQNEPLEGIRNPKYKPKSSSNQNMMQYKLDWGADCALTALVGKDILNSAAEIPLTIQCTSDDEFQQSKLKCKKL
jgi:hypothetical protein